MTVFVITNATIQTMSYDVANLETFHREMEEVYEAWFEDITDAEDYLKGQLELEECKHIIELEKGKENE